MRGFADSPGGLIVSALLAGAVAVAAFPLLGADGWVFRETGLDFRYLAPWLTAGAALLLASMVASRARGLFRRRSETEEGRNALRRCPSAAARSLLAGSGWSVILLGLVAAVPDLPATISGRPGGPDLASLDPYLQIFDSLLAWAIVVLALFVAVRSYGAVRPAFGEIIGFPWRQLLVLAAAYVLLADGGVLSVAFDFSDYRILLVLALALGLPYLASVLRRIAQTPLPRRVRLATQATLLLADCGWILLLVGLVAALPGVADSILDDGLGAEFDVVTPYLKVLDTLAGPSSFSARSFSSGRRRRSGLLSAPSSASPWCASSCLPPRWSCSRMTASWQPRSSSPVRS